MPVWHMLMRGAHSMAVGWNVRRSAWTARHPSPRGLAPEETALRAKEFLSARVGSDVLVPVSAPASEADPTALHALPGTPEAPVSSLSRAIAERFWSEVAITPPGDVH